MLLANYLLQLLYQYFKGRFMRKIILLPLLVLGFANAAETNTTNRAVTMQGLEDGMVSIQKGLMYNNKDMVKEGVVGIKKHTKDIDSFHIENEAGSSFKANKYATNEAKSISHLADEMRDAFVKGNDSRVLDTYRKIQSRCMTCHKLVRKW